ncbi:hypothetical protein C6495_07795 [Candidatus Poribacteria bacterium]|nr:MAG: hypothetical protein C6495_07795 [Candidatus Poribacteria bacterium]
MRLPSPCAVENRAYRACFATTLRKRAVENRAYRACFAATENRAYRACFATTLGKMKFFLQTR